MCDNDEPARLTRRSLIMAGGLGVASLLLPADGWAASTAGRPAPGSLNGSTGLNALAWVKHAMHVHASGSEMTASMALQLYQASRWGLDYVWWTEHGWRTMALGYRQFIGFHSNPEPEGDRDLYFLPAPAVGPVTRSGGGVEASPPSPLDPGGGALYVYAQGSTATEASQQFLVSNGSSLSSSRLMIPYRGWISRVALHLELIPTVLENGSFLQLAIHLSDHPGGRCSRSCAPPIRGSPRSSTGWSRSTTSSTTYWRESTGRWSDSSVRPTAWPRSAPR